MGGGVAALLALGGASLLIARRRRREDEVEYYADGSIDEADAAPEAAAEPHFVEGDAGAIRNTAVAEEPAAYMAPPASAFAWSAANHGGTRETEDAIDDRRPGETWVERAYRGPTPNNPSVSLRNRLRRAAFFDKRERDVAEGRAVPIDADAGLPQAASTERELVDA